MESVQVLIPKSLYTRVEKLCKEISCEDVNELLVRLLRERVSEVEEEIFSAGVSEEEREEIVKRLKEKGYL
ncbi:hypothetical protein IPA_05440 [Ignicoccus pacificus DSM 13166]|uniref:CopG family transcriptional regulator n=1 Tax=Ignicoccus pacificus DSM 13166 TaxID=940294 RepID=A0A977K9L9_9CREN|nr:hypothetical protein IPA_05440 [Ignicoccus pacificus DSM 13166]